VEIVEQRQGTGLSFHRSPLFLTGEGNLLLELSRWWKGTMLEKPVRNGDER
jgi:hypothetical protein